MKRTALTVEGVPAVLYGEPANAVWLYVHGRCGCKEEGETFAELACPRGWQVLAVDLPEHGARKGEPGFDPWHVVPELRAALACAGERFGRVALRATSIGAWFSLLAFADTPPERALFVSPVLDMQKLICRMMTWAGVDEARLEREGEIPTDFGQTLSWEYLQYVRNNPVTRWTAPTSILYAQRDELTDCGTAQSFAKRFGCALTVAQDGEHYFHTPAQLALLRSWEENNL